MLVYDINITRGHYFSGVPPIVLRKSRRRNSDILWAMKGKRATNLFPNLFLEMSDCLPPYFLVVYLGLSPGQLDLRFSAGVQLRILVTLHVTCTLRKSISPTDWLVVHHDLTFMPQMSAALARGRPTAHPALGALPSIFRRSKTRCADFGWTTGFSPMSGTGPGLSVVV